MAAQRFLEPLLHVWREACRHIEIGDAVARIAPLVRNRVPLDFLLVRRIDMERMAVETVGAGQDGPPADSLARRTTFGPRQFEQFLAWCRQGRVARLGAADPQTELHSMIPDGVGTEVLAGPLCGSAGPLGALLLAAPAGVAFSDVHAEVAAALCEPLSVALENDARLRELAAMREAAEADRQSLLARLGRREMGEAINRAAILGDGGGLEIGKALGAAPAFSAPTRTPSAPGCASSASTGSGSGKLDTSPHKSRICGIRGGGCH